tara:strand:+ start:100 stop:1080 length:981 start_codon:yes stop_codon:yes gene_type:complete
MAVEVDEVPLFLAPMAGVTDLAFRLLAKECGADFTITEFTAAAALTRLDAKSWHKVESDPRERPFIPQIFGGNVDDMVRSTELLQETADIIDLNFGCPAPKVTRHCAGAALMGKPDDLVNMVSKCVEASSVPVTVKMRQGTGTGPDTVIEVSKRLEDVGATRLCVHGRTLRQRYSGTADWETIRKVVDAVEVPVIANGDIIDASSARACLEATGADGLMIGRAAIGRPEVFARIKQDLGWYDGELPWSDTCVSSRSWAWNRYIHLDDEVNPGNPSRNRVKHAFSFTKGLPGGKAFRSDLHSDRSPARMARLVGEFLEQVDSQVPLA